jgi:response regulator RpfG family c-di-GMP phosphodiesterase
VRSSHRVVSAPQAHSPRFRLTFPLHVVIVDDTESDLRSYAELVRDLGGGEAQCFSRTAEALAWVTGHDVDCLIIDYKKPDPDGLTLIELVRGLPDKENVPILLVTVDRAQHVRRAALDLGVNDFLTKPIDFAEFAARLRNMLALRQTQRQLGETATWLAEQVKAATAELVARERETILTLSVAAERADPETPAHVARVARYCESIARTMGVPKAQQELLLATAPLHDIGKIGIPDAILTKTGKLTAEEFAVMKRHTIIGYDILKQGRSATMQMAAQIALNHHERWDGSGYPHGLRGDQIPLVARICAVSDVFDALTSSRSYKDSLPVDAAAHSISAGAGRDFDPAVVDAFSVALPHLLTIRERFPEERR